MLEPGENLGGIFCPPCSVERLQPVTVPRLHHISMYPVRQAPSRDCHCFFPIFSSFWHGICQGTCSCRGEQCRYAAGGGPHRPGGPGGGTDARGGNGEFRERENETECCIARGHAGARCRAVVYWPWPAWRRRCRRPATSIAKADLPRLSRRSPTYTTPSCAALLDLHFLIFTEEAKDGKAFVVTKTTNGKKVRIYLNCLSSPIPAEGLIMRVSIRVACFGDEAVSVHIFDQIAFRLSHPWPGCPRSAGSAADRGRRSPFNKPASKPQSRNSLRQ